MKAQRAARTQRRRVVRFSSSAVFALVALVNCVPYVASNGVTRWHEGKLDPNDRWRRLSVYQLRSRHLLLQALTGDLLIRRLRSNVPRQPVQKQDVLISSEPPKVRNYPYLFVYLCLLIDVEPRNSPTVLESMHLFCLQMEADSTFIFFPCVFKKEQRRLGRA